MANEKMVKVCKNCSNIDVKALRDKVGKKGFSFGCVGRCQERNPQLKGKVYGYINGKFVVCEKQNEFFKKIDEFAQNGLKNPHEKQTA